MTLNCSGPLLKNLDSIGKESLQAFINKQMELNLMSPKMAILFLKKVSKFDLLKKSELVKMVSELENGELIINKICPAHNQTH